MPTMYSPIDNNVHEITTISCDKCGKLKELYIVSVRYEYDDVNCIHHFCEKCLDLYKTKLELEPLFERQ